jgi:transcriptional/translational regulatory protein YebC/TACO1
MTPQKVPVIIECLTDNRNRTAPDMRSLFRDGQLGAKVMFFFDHVGIVEATHEDGKLDLETAAIEAGAQDVERLVEANEDVTGGRFLHRSVRSGRGHTASLRKNGWSVTLSEMGYRPKEKMVLEAESHGIAREIPRDRRRPRRLPPHLHGDRLIARELRRSPDARQGT